MNTFVTIVFVADALVMVLSILLQSGKGGGLGSALGGGASQTVFRIPPQSAAPHTAHSTIDARRGSSRSMAMGV